MNGTKQSRRNPDFSDVHDIALSAGAVYFQPQGQGVSNYVFTPEQLSSLMVHIALNAVDALTELRIGKGGHA